jgi:hypothetical protein
MGHVVFIHGLDNKPEADYLHELWCRKLAHDEGLDLATSAVETAMCYWADVLYGSPDTNLAAYERAAGSIETLDSPPAQPLDLSRLSAADAERMRRLAARLGVDPAAMPAEAPTAAEVEAVRQERVPMPAWLRKRIMARFARDAHHYFFNVESSPRPGARYKVRDELRRRTVATLQAGAAHRPLVVVSHSMGTVIAYDCLMHEPDCPIVDGFMTIGSPLGVDEVQDFFPAWTRNDGFPAAKLAGPWVNVFDPLDPIAALDPYLANDYRRAGKAVVEDLREDNWGTWRHSISKYLQGPQLRRRLAGMLKVEWG